MGNAVLDEQEQLARIRNLRAETMLKRTQARWTPVQAVTAAAAATAVIVAGLIGATATITAAIITHH